MLRSDLYCVNDTFTRPVAYVVRLCKIDIGKSYNTEEGKQLGLGGGGYRMTLLISTFMSTGISPVNNIMLERCLPNVSHVVETYS